MMASAEVIQAAFRNLQPLCVSLTKEPSLSGMIALKECIVKVIDKKVENLTYSQNCSILHLSNSYDKENHLIICMFQLPQEVIEEMQEYIMFPMRFILKQSKPL